MVPRRRKGADSNSSLLDHKQRVKLTVTRACPDNVGVV